ncbi:MAG: hypothetical protein EOP10_18855 [Proteobacteria bacterium]|nr:MAG: hypothetical protein EOP10_18855 [Pseudomonadota bacterium]
MNNGALKTAALLSGLVATSAFAQGETGSPASKAGATFWIDHNVLTYSSNTTDPDEGADKKESAWETTPDDVTLGIFWKNYGVYVTPASGKDGGLGMVGLSLFPTKEVEVGINLGTNRSKDDNGANELERTSDLVGLFGTYYLQLDAISTLELQAWYTYANSEVESLNGTGAVVKTETKTNQFKIGVQYDYQIAEHFHIVPGIFFNAGNSDVDGPTSDSKDDASGIIVNLAHFRYVF